MAEPVGVSILWEDKEFRQGVLFYLNSMAKMQAQTAKAATQISTQMAKAGSSTKKAANQAAQSSRKWQTAMTGMMRTGRQLLPIIGIVGAARAVQNYVNDSIKDFARFQKGMAEVFTLMPDLSKAARIRMELDILALGTEYGRLTTETVPALYQAISAGIPPENVMTFMKTASDAARGGVTDLRTSVDVLTTVINAYGSDVITAKEASDALFAAVQGGKVTFTELAKTAFNVIPVAASLGVEFQDVTASIAAMTKQGVPARTATTQLRQVLINISQDGREASEVFERMTGVTFAEFIEQGGNLHDAMMVIEQAAEELGVTAADLFGNIRAGQGALVLTGQGGRLFAKELDRAASSADAMSEAAETMEETLSFSLDQARAATEQYKILVGEGLDPLARAWANLKVFMGSGIAEIQLGAKAVEASEAAWDASQHTLDEMTQRIHGVVTTMAELEGSEKTATKLAGGFAIAKESIREMLIEMIRVSDSTSQAKARIQIATGAQVKYNQATHLYTIELENLGVISLGSSEKLGELLHTSKVLTEEEKEAIVVEIERQAAMEEEAEAATVLAGILAELTNEVSKYFTRILETSDVQDAFNDLLFDLAETGEFSIEEMEELARSTGRFSDAEIEAARVMARAKKEAEERIAVMEETGETHYEIIEALQEEYEETIRLIQADLDLVAATEEVIVTEEDRIRVLEEAIARSQAFNAKTGGLFSQMIEGKDEVGFFTSAIEGLGQQWVRVGGRTAEQNRVLGELTDQYDRADLAVRDYQGGVKGITLDEDARNEKIAEQTELMGLLGEKMGGLQNITGSLVSVYVPAILNQETMNEELYKAAEGAGANAFALAALGVELGIFSEGEAKAALKAAAMASKIEQLGTRIADGSISVEGAIIQMGNFADTLDEDYTLQLTTGGIERTAEDLDRLTTGVQEVAVGAETAVAETVDAYADLESELGREIDIIDTHLGGFQGGMERAKDAGIGAAEATKEEVATHWGDMEASVSESAMTHAENMGIIETSTATALQNIQKVMGLEGVAVVDAVELLGFTMIGVYEEELDAMPNLTVELLEETVREGMGTIPEFYALGADLVVGLAAGAGSQDGHLSHALSGIVLNALAAAEAAAEARSPSKRMFRLGRDLIFGLIFGMEDLQRPLQITGEQFVELIASRFEDLRGGIYRIAAKFKIRQLSDITEEFFEALHHKLGLSSNDIDGFVKLLNNKLIPSLEAWWREIDRLIDLASAFSSAGDTFAQMFTEDTLDPIQAMIDEIDDRSGDLIDSLQEVFDLSEEEILARLPELIAFAESRGYTETLDQLTELRTLQEERNAAEAEFAAEQERILELQRQQQQLSFLQAQLDLIRSLEEAGIDPADIFGGMTLGLEASLPDLIEAMNAALAALIGTVNAELDIGSPSKVFMEVGRQVMRGLGQGIFAGSQEVSLLVDDAFRQTLTTAIPLITVASPIINVPVQGASAGATNNYNFGDTYVNDQLDAALFQEQVRDIISEDF